MEDGPNFISMHHYHCYSFGSVSFPAVFVSVLTRAYLEWEYPAKLHMHGIPVNGEFGH